MQLPNADYVIVGAGAGGLHLALAMLEDSFFTGKRIVILDADPKTSNDRTWCFWETGAGRFDEIVHQQWQAAEFVTSDKRYNLDLKPYTYKMVRGIDFYEFAKKKISGAPSVEWISQRVTDIVKRDRGVEIHTGEIHERAAHVFDSRISTEFHKSDDHFIRLWQHFRGWQIRTSNEVFKPGSFTMMDFSVKWKDMASFTYILPLSPREALVEFTLFTGQVLEDHQYEDMLREYISSHLDTGGYEILETENGVIPMSNYPFHRHSTASITKIGTAGGWVKPSSGYSFKNAERNAARLIDNIKSGADPLQGMYRRRFRFYDSVFLRVLHDDNHLGEELFTDMYTKNPTALIFKFLDEETTLREDLKIIGSFRTGPFLRALMKQIM